MSLTTQSATPALDLSRCENEPVHIPGSIQPHGVLAVIDPEGRITCVSDNAHAHFGFEPSDLLGRPLSSLASIADRADVVANLLRGDLEERNPFRLTLANGKSFDAIAHRHDGRLLLECEPQREATDFAQAYFYNRVRASLVRVRATNSLEELCESTAREVQLLTGFDRVLIYRFKPDFSGEVVAEASASNAALYLGLRFPASDIPAQARALYARCRLRMIPTSTYEPARLLGLGEDRPVDLTHAVLRSISPVHLEYMRNMGVTASMGISLMQDDRLWGLITCNHESGDRFIPYEARAACGLVGEVVSSLLGPKETIRATERRVAYQNVRAELLQFVSLDRDVPNGLTKHSPSLLDVTHSTGAAFCVGDRAHCVGETPSPEDIRDLVTWLSGEGKGAVVLDSLPSRYAKAHAWKNIACGLIASRVTLRESGVASAPCWLLWFRPEVAQTVAWGGDPNKPIAPASPNDRLRPRKSFEAWKEEVHLKSAPFDDSTVLAATALADALGDVILEIEASRQLKANALLLEESNRQLVQQIAENQRVELELRRAQKLEAVGRLAAGIAHEINTPLQFVSDSVSFLRDATSDLVALVEDPSPSAKEERDYDYLVENMPKAIERAVGGIERVSTIVRAMKSFAQPDTAEKVLANINEAIAATVEIARGNIREVADLTLDLGPVPTVACYLGDLNQVVLSLIVNAGEAIEPTIGEARTLGSISIKTWASESSVFIAVADDGTGIPENIRESVFLPFFTTKELGRGTGQGLAICHAIVVEKHGGSLDFETEVGRGTTFTVRLPLDASS